VPNAGSDFFFSSAQTVYERRFQAALRDGIAHGSQIRPRDPNPGEPVRLLFTTNARLAIDRLAVYYTTDGSEPRGERGISPSSAVVLAEPEMSERHVEADLPVRLWSARIPGQREGTLVRYRADGWSLADPRAHWYADNVDPVGIPPDHGRLFAYSVDRFRPPPWLDDAVIYHLMVDRFSAAQDEPPIRDPGNITGFFGGTLAGVLERLDYLRALGITCVWLSPIFESPSAHGYDPTDYFHVAARYGGDEALRRLIARAHQMGLRIVLDFVANHTSDQHPLFRDARAHPEGQAARWYAFGDWPPHGYASYAGTGTMPELATERPEVQRYLTDAALYWMGEFGVDGLRLDYVPGPPHAFWAVFQRGIKRQFPRALTLGEITTPLSEIATYAGRMDAYMDFPLTRMLRQVFALRSAPLSDLMALLDTRQSELPPGMGRATLLDNHDMHRFLWLAGGDKRRLKLAATCHLTLEGTPIVYYGTEVGLSQTEDAQRQNAYARAPMVWGEQQDHALLAHYRALVALRQAHPALRRGARTTLPVQVVGDGAADAQQVGAYLRWLGSDTLVVVLNNAEQPCRVRIALGAHQAARRLMEGKGRGVRNLLAPDGVGKIYFSRGTIELELPALSAAVLTRVRRQWWRRARGKYRALPAIGMSG
jgi:cyclomaltodextrinase